MSNFYFEKRVHPLHLPYTQIHQPRVLQTHYTQGGHKLCFFMSGKAQFVTVGII